MGKAIIGKKVGMTQVFTEDGTVVPVTVVEAGPCVVVNTRIADADGYNALQLGYDKILKQKKINRPMGGYFKKQGVDPVKVLKEFRVENPADYQLGQELTVEMFTEGELVDVQGTTIGKGTQGVMKRHGFSGGPKTHGSNFHRRPGSIGMCEFPGETPKGKKMAGQMGAKTMTVQRLQVVKVMADQNLILVKGAIPGHKNSVIYIKETVKPTK